MSIPILTLLFALILRSAARKKGLTSPRIWVFPLLAGAILSLLCLSCLTLEEKFDVIGQENLRRLYGFAVEFGASLLLVVLSFRTWKMIQSLPTPSGNDDQS